MRIAVLVKQVPDTAGERRLDSTTWTIDRIGAEPVLDEISAKAVELGLRLTEEHGGTVTLVTMGPAGATPSLRQAFAMGAVDAVHISDDALGGSDMMGTSATLAAAVRTGEYELILAGNESTDGRGAAVPAMVAERLGLPVITSVRRLTVDAGTITAERVLDGGWAAVSVALPAVVTVHEKVGEPRYPTFKGIMAAKKRPIASRSIAELGLEDERLGACGSATVVLDGAPRPPRSAGRKVTDDGTAGARLGQFLTDAQLA